MSEDDESSSVELVGSSREREDEFFATARRRVSAFQDSKAEGEQTFSPERSQHELKLAKHELTAEETRSHLEESRLDNASRRKREQIGFYTVLSVVVVGLATSGIIGVAAKNSNTRDWAQGVFTLILGTLLGALAGYFTGKGSK